MNPTAVLTRLRIAHLLFGMMFWFGIEQLFLDRYIGLHAARGYVTIMFALGLLLFDIPTGLLADRIGRKKTLLLACLTLGVCLPILGSSRVLAQYLFGALLFGLFIALWNGASQALLYDWLASKNETNKYAKYQGGVYALFLLGAGLANFGSGFMVNRYGLASPYYLSLIPAALAAWTLWNIYEPEIEKVETAIWYKHLGEIMGMMRRDRRVVLYSLRFIVSQIVVLTIGEFGQIYMLTFGISTVMLGILWGIDGLFAAGGRTLAHRFQLRPRLFIAVYCLVLGAFIIVQHSLGIGLFWLVYGLNEALANVAETEIQHATASRVRATTLSIVSFSGNLLAVPIILAYTALYTRSGIFFANRLLGGIMIVMLLITLLEKRNQST